MVNTKLAEILFPDINNDLPDLHEGLVGDVLRPPPGGRGLLGRVGGPADSGAHRAAADRCGPGW